MLLWVISIFMCLAPHYAQGLGLSSGLGKKAWNFEFVSLETNTTDENLVNINVALKQVSRGTYAITGTALFNVDFKENDLNMIEALVYRRATGSSEYKVTPFTMPKQHFFSFMSTFYKDYLMESLGKCSDFPVFKGKFQPPFEKKAYKLNECRLTNDGMPPFMADGFYKVIVTGTGDVEYTIFAVVQVENET